VFKRRLLWKIYFAYLLVILLCALAISGNAVEGLQLFFMQDKYLELEHRCRLVEPQFTAALARPDGDLDALCKSLGQASQTRITVIRSDGTVLGDTLENPSEMVNHATLDRTEVLAALAGQVGMRSRWSDTERLHLVYVAVPLWSSEKKVAGVLRLSVELTQVEEAVAQVNRRIGLGMLVVVLLTSLLALYLSWRFSRPLTEIREGVKRFAAGDFSHKLRPGGHDEIADLAQALNTMAAHLGERIDTVTRLQRELSAVLSSMTEGVLAVDDDDRIISVNDAASEILNIPEADVRGRSLFEVVRHPDLQKFVARLRSSHGVSEGEIVVTGGKGQRQLQLHGGPLRDARDQVIGVLVVFKDVTRLRHLETVRRDFVANVSHELRTPITAIQGSVETLRESAINDPESAGRFLEIIGRQSERMIAIIDDLLALSRIELDAENQRIEVTSAKVASIVRAAISNCQGKANERTIALEVSCPEDLVAQLNPQLIEQAISNLLDNAIKYSNPGSRVTVEVGRHDGDLAIRVRDQGCGIPSEHLPRIFERFYCVDKARSRKLGGTGLGLSIVKHIVQAHGGSATVESAVGAGCTFTLHLPSGAAGQ
jgi:two-component system phosphate regulon sensor histidine kinase PhoR